MIGQLYAAEATVQAEAAGDARAVVAGRQARVAPVVETIRQGVAGQRAARQAALAAACAPRLPSREALRLAGSADNLSTAAWPRVRVDRWGRRLPVR